MKQFAARTVSSLVNRVDNYVSHPTSPRPGFIHPCFFRLLNKSSAVLAILSVWFLTQNCVDQRMIKEGHYHSGISAAIGGEMDEAARLFQMVLDLDSTNIPARVCLQIVNDVLEKNLDQSAATLLFQGIDLGNKGLEAEKIDVVTQSIRIAPRYALAYNERAIAYHNMGNYLQAIEDRTRLLELDPKNIIGHFNRAIDCEKIGWYKEAMKSYEQFIQLAPERYSPHINIATDRVDYIEQLLRDSYEQT